MRGMSFTQEMKELAQAGEGMDVRGCWHVLDWHWELGRNENARARRGGRMPPLRVAGLAVATASLPVLSASPAARNRAPMR